MKEQNQDLISFILKMSGVKSNTEEFKMLRDMIKSSVDYETAMKNYKRIGSSLRKYREFYEAQFFRLLKIYYDPYLNSRVREALKSFEIPDIPGDLHTHTTWSDGVNSLEEMVEYAEKLGYEYIAITDHTLVGKSRVQMDEKKFLRQLEEIEKLQRKSGVRILKSAEVDINESGDLDYSERILNLMDFVLVPIHFDYGHGIKKIIELFEAAVSNEHIDIIAHPLNKFGIENFKKYGDRILDLVEKNGKVLEFNLFPDRIRENDLLYEMIKDRNIMVSFSTDSHRIEHLEFMRFANFWLEKIGKDRVYNYSFLKGVGKGEAGSENRGNEENLPRP